MFDARTVSQIQKIADDLRVEPAALLAVAEVESAGVATWRVKGRNLPPIRFEGHYFHRLLKGKQLQQAIRQGLASPKAGAVKNPSNYAARYDLLERAAKINREAAYASTSWGLGQVMGEHAKKLGYGTAVALAERAMSGVAGQVEIMSRYIDKFKLVDELQRKGWADFARQYNGKNYKSNRYDTKMAAAYKRWSRPGSSIETAESSSIAAIQKDLQRLGHYKGLVDGVAGPKTRAAIKSFQRSQGLVVDGKYGPMTDAAVDKALAKLDRRRGDKAIKTGTGTTGVGAAVDVVKEQTDQLQTVSQYSHVIEYLVVALVLAGVALAAYGIWTRYKSPEETE